MESHKQTLTQRSYKFLLIEKIFEHLPKFHNDEIWWANFDRYCNMSIHELEITLQDLEFNPLEYLQETGNILYKI